MNYILYNKVKMDDIWSVIAEFVDRDTYKNVSLCNKVIYKQVSRFNKIPIILNKLLWELDDKIIGIHSIKYIIKYKKINYNKYFIVSCEYGHLDVVKYLMTLDEKYKIDPSANNNIEIRWACSYGHLDVVKYLMSLDEKYKIDPSADNNLAIRWACRYGHLDIVKYLMSLDEKYKIDRKIGEEYLKN